MLVPAAYEQGAEQSGLMLPESEAVAVVNVKRGGRLVSNVAVTVNDCVSATRQLPVPGQSATLQPAKSEPSFAVGDSITSAPSGSDSLQSGSHEIPAGLLVTLPLPSPSRVTVSTCSPGGMGAAVKRAVIAVSLRTVTRQGLVPSHPPPLQPVKVAPVTAVATNLIGVPRLTLVRHAPPQSIPDCWLMIRPAPSPAFRTVTVAVCGVSVNRAVAVRA